MQVFADHLRLFVWMPALALVIGAAVLLLTRPKYVSESRIRPDANNAGANRIAGLAAQFGVAIPGGGADPVKLYVEMLGSQLLLRETLNTHYDFSRQPESPDSLRATLLDILKAHGDTPSEKLQSGVRKLKKMMDVLPNEGAGTVRVRIESRWPQLSEQVNRRLLSLLNAASLEARHSQAGSEREFVQGRLEQAQGELSAAEAELQRFSEENRTYQNSPQLIGQAERLRRRVDLRQQLFLSLSQAYEQARIDEVRTTPVLVVLDPPEGTSVRQGRFRDIVIWLIIGIVLAAAVSVADEMVTVYRWNNPDRWDELHRTFSRELRRAFFFRRTAQ